MDLEAVKDPMLRKVKRFNLYDNLCTNFIFKGLEDQIRHFGQTPAQLLSEPHPPRISLDKVPAPLPVQGLNPKDPGIIKYFFTSHSGFVVVVVCLYILFCILLLLFVYIFYCCYYCLLIIIIFNILLLLSLSHLG